ncbi:NAD(P)/FAD-dependent oxidoreductase [Roseateles sp. BYS180W]|uniref:NAD(P)/FAD-dependent oxidoreductase n=1 Tax=Roseateles rivi TaxID=3299028 RepID=A0ABW7FZA8_9BURK
MRLLQLDQELQRGSYYAATAAREAAQPPLQGLHEADVAVVGGGLAGLNAALELAERGMDVALLEADLVGSGASGRNGGQALHGLACDHSVIEGQLGPEGARQVWDMSLEALALIQERCARHHIDAEWRSGYLCLATSPRKAQALKLWTEHMNQRYDSQLRWIYPAELDQWIDSPRYHAGLHDPRSGHLHPLKYCLGLARAAQAAGVRVFEHSPVTALEHGRSVLLRTAFGQLRARQVLLAGNAYLPAFAPQLAPELSARIMPVGTYIVCTEPLQPQRLQALMPSGSAVCDSNFVLDYFRPTADHRLLYGGRVSYSTATPRRLVASMRQRLVQSFPSLCDVELPYAWGGFVDITMNRAPDFGRLGQAQNVYYLQGFSGHGVALTGLAGRVVAEAMHGDAARFDTFARLRHRAFPGGALLRTPALVLGMTYYRLKDLL